MNLDQQTNDFIASQEARDDEIDQIRENTHSDYDEAVRRYDVSRRAHLNAIDYDDEPDCGDENR